MKRKNKSPKGPRGGATRGGGRGRGRGSRGGSRSTSESLAQPQSQRGAARGSTRGRGRGRGSQLSYHNVSSTNFPKVNGNFDGPSSSSSKANLSDGDQSAGPKVPSDFYLHKKFKKLTNTVTEDIATPELPAASSNVSNLNGLKPGMCNGISLQHNHTVVKSSDNVKNDSTIESSVITQKSQSLGSNFPANNEKQNHNNLASTSQSSNNMVYKPKFRIASESESKSIAQNLNGLSPPNSASCSPSSQGDSDAACSDAGKVSKSLRFDRQSLDDRISKIIDENQLVLEWPEHFTKKLKSHTSRNSQSSHTNNQSQRTNQLTIMSGGSTTELHSSKSNPSSSQHPLAQPPHNGLVRHSSFDMTSSGGTVEFLTNPLIMKAQADMLKSTFSQIPPNTLSMPDLQLPLGANTASMMVPKKRRRLSPTPSRLCGGEVSELPVNEIALSKNYYQDVDMNVRVNNCSGAKVTIRTSSGSGGCIQSAVKFGRYNEGVPSSPLVMDNTPMFFPTTPVVPKGEDMFSFRDKDEIGSSRSRRISKSPKRKNARPIKTITDSLPPPSPIPEPLALDIKTSKKRSPSGSLSITSSSKPSSTTVSSKGSPNSSCVEDTSSSLKGKPFQVVQNTNNNPKRPNFLALKPVNNVTKKSDVGVLPSPETPRVAKSYNQMSINGNAYTYLGFKVSTRSSYTCLFKPQPMFIPQSRDPKLSMYSNWQPCPKDPKDPALSMSTNDSRVNGRKDVKTLYTSATGKNCDTITVSSPTQTPIASPLSEKSPLTLFSNGLSAPITGLSRSSEPTTLNSKVISYPTSFSTTSFTTTKASLGSQLSPSKTTITSSVARAISMLSSSSDLSSADESSNFSRMDYKVKRESADSPLSLVSKKNDMGKVFMREDSNSASDSIKSEMITRSDGSRVRIMEGGFESNEAYTYVRGRGSGRFVCDTCGIRCKKPSMLRKHLKTHTDLRPYTCKLCNFSFKTKGNLTKHQKSKSHHKKCISMGIHPDSSQSLASTGPHMDSNSENDSDDDDDDENGDTDSQGEDGDGTSSAGNDSESVEKEIALSLLDLSRMSRRPSESHEIQSSDWKQKQKTLTFSVGTMLEKEISPATMLQPTSSAVGETPMDLRVKPNKSTTATCEEPALKRPKLELNGLVKSIGVVSEAQRWQPDEELISNGSFNLKKVLNTGQTTSPKSRTSPPVDNNPFNREIKQEVFDYPCDSNDRPCNGFIDRLSRSRKDSDTSVASNSSVNSFTANSSLSADTRLNEPPPGSSQAKSHKKLHQPWLSSPEKKTLEVDKKKEAGDDVKPGEAAVEKCSTPVVESTNGPSKDLTDDIPSPNGKIFANVAAGKPQAEFRQPSGAQALVKEDGKAECNVCGKTFARASQLTLHMNIHYLERPFRCDPCGVSFRTKGHLIKHRRSSSHDCKAIFQSLWGVANTENPRPFKCPDCKIAFRIHGHLAKHLRSKMHIMRMECLGKLPFGIYFEMEKSGMNLNEIDTTDCDMSLVSLQGVAKKIYGDTWTERLTIPVEEPA